MIGKRIITLATAIAEHEGYIPDNLGTIEKNEESLAFRNNNPGNLRQSPFMLGQKNGFAYFYTEQIGWFALYFDLFKKARGETVTNLRPDSTIEDLIEVYAPPHENNTQAYIDFIVKKTGFPAKMELKKLLEL